MPVSLIRDVSTFFMCFTKVCRQADDLLFRSGNAEAVDKACKRATVGRLPAERRLCALRGARLARASAPGVRGLRPGIPGRGRGGEPDQAAPAFGEVAIDEWRGCLDRRYKRRCL